MTNAKRQGIGAAPDGKYIARHGPGQKQNGP
jgi:hypothetical protein